MFAAVCDLDPLWKRPIVAPPPSNPEMSGASWRDEETTGGDATPGAQPRGQTVLSLSPASLLFDDADDKETVLAKANHRRTSGYGTSGDVQDSLRVRGRVFASDRRDTDDQGSRELQPRQRRTEGVETSALLPAIVSRGTTADVRRATTISVLLFVDVTLAGALIIVGRFGTTRTVIDDATVTSRRQDLLYNAESVMNSRVMLNGFLRVVLPPAAGGSNCDRPWSYPTRRRGEPICQRRTKAVDSAWTTRDGLALIDAAVTQSAVVILHVTGTDVVDSLAAAVDGEDEVIKVPQVDMNPPRMMRPILNSGFIGYDCVLLMAKVRLKLSWPTFKIVQTTIGGERKINWHT